MGRGKALSVFGICGIAGVLVDLDHLLVVLWHREPITWPNLVKYGRPGHIAVLMVACIVSGAMGALLAGQAFLKEIDTDAS
jgi:hypothetical protein